MDPKLLLGLVKLALPANATKVVGPRWPTRNGFVHMLRPACDAALGAAAAGGHEVEEILRHCVAELAEVGLRHAAPAISSIAVGAALDGAVHLGHREAEAREGEVGEAATEPKA